MSRFDLFVNTDEDSRTTYPYLLNIQTELIEMLNSRVVIPLTPVYPDTALPSILCPKFEIANDQYYLLTHQITTVPTSLLKIRQGTLSVSRTDIINAIDFLLSGV